MRLFVVLVVSLVTFGSPVLAQITSATISGTIKDENGGVLPGADVVINIAPTSVCRTARSSRARPITRRRWRPRDR